MKNKSFSLKVVAVAATTLLAACSSGSSDTSKVASPSATIKSVKLNSGACMVIAGDLVKVHDVLVGLGTTTTAADAIGALKGASESWSGQAGIATSPEAAAWLTDMSTQAAMLRVKLDAGDYGDTAIAVEKALINLMNENTTYCQ